MSTNKIPTTKKKDKAVITDEVWTDDRIKLFLDVEPAEGINADFHRLLKAYQSMRPEHFEKFVSFFTDAGGDIHACDPEGQTVADILKQHKNSDVYLNALS